MRAVAARLWAGGVLGWYPIGLVGLGAGAVLSVGALLAGIGLPGLPQARPDGRSCAALMACPCAYGPGPHTLASSGVRGVSRPRQRPGRFWSQRAGSCTPAAPAAVPLPPSKRHFGAVSGACGHKYAVLAPGCARARFAAPGGAGGVVYQPVGLLGKQLVPARTPRRLRRTRAGVRP